MAQLGSTKIFGDLTATGTAKIPTIELDGTLITATAAELNYVDGVTSSIQTQLNAKAPINNPTFTGTVSGITKAMVGLGNVDNTSDANKPISTATQTALNGKLSLTGGTLTGALNGTTIATSGAITAPTFNGNATSSTTSASTYTGIIQDTRAAQKLPTEYSENKTMFEFTDKITGLNDWKSAITFRGWVGSYALWQLIGPSSTSADENLYFRSGINSTWNSVRTVLHSGNYSSYALPLTGGTLTGPVTTSTTSLAMITNNSSNNGGLVMRSSGAGDSNLAGATFYNDNYALKLGIRADGYFGLGGWSRAAWSWYSDPSGNMVAAGNVTAYSDPRLKENFKSIENPIEKVKLLNGGTFNWKEGFEHTAIKAGKKDYGILANEVEEIMPELVTDSIEIDGEKFKTVDYARIVPLLIEAIKEQQKQIEELKALAGK